MNPSAQIDSSKTKSQALTQRGFAHVVILSLIVISSLVVLGTLFYFKDSNQEYNITQVNNQNELKGYVSYVSGNAWTLTDGRRTELKESDTVFVGTKIQTENNSRVVIALDDGSIIRLDANTTIILESLNPNEIIVNEENGQIYSRVNKDENHKYIVKANDVVVESLGTAFTVENKDEVSVKVFDSTVKVKKENVDSEVEVTENKKWEEDSNEVKNITEEEVKGDEFVSWNIDEDIALNKEVIKKELSSKTSEDIENEQDKNTAKVETKKVDDDKVEEKNTGITLTSASKEKGVHLFWTTSGLDTSKGYKILKNTSGNPTFPEDGYIYVENPNTKNYYFDLKDGKTWFIKVCQYLSSGDCGAYSNQIKFTAPDLGGEENKHKGDGVDVDSISIDIDKKSDSKVRVSWDINGTAGQGVKVVWSTESKPKYGEDSSQYVDSKGDGDTYVDGLKDGKKYYFRVCAYTGDGCTAYSNEKSVEM